MRLPRNVKMLRGPMDSSALAGTMLLLWTVVLLHSSLVLPSGMHLRLPEAEAGWAETLPDLTLAVDGAGRLLFEQQILSESNLLARLGERTAYRGTNQTLLLLADRSVPLETVSRLMRMVRGAGVRDVVLATSPKAPLPRTEAASLVPAARSGKP